MLITGCAGEPPEVVDSAADESAEVGPELFAPGVISTDAFELGTSFSPDGRTVYFGRIGEGFESAVILSSTFDGASWSAPAPVSFAGPYRDLDPFVSPDGRRLYFQSDRPVDGDEAKDWDIWVSDRTAEGWGEPRNLGPPINTPSTETYPTVTADGTLYFSSDRDGAASGDVYRAPWRDGAFLAPESLGAPINTQEFDSNVYASPDERFLIFSAENRAGHRGGGDLYLSRRTEAGWSEPRPLPFVNTPAREFAPAGSPDGRYLYFTRDQRDPEAGATFAGEIYRIELTALGFDGE